jgi:hypothetical protein
MGNFIKYSLFVKKKRRKCVSKVEMSPELLKLKCPHGTGEDTHGAEGVKEVASDGTGEGRKDYPEGGRGEDRCILPAGKTN